MELIKEMEASRRESVKKMETFIKDRKKYRKWVAKAERMKTNPTHQQAQEYTEQRKK